MDDGSSVLDVTALGRRRTSLNTTTTNLRVAARSERLARMEARDTEQRSECQLAGTPARETEARAQRVTELLEHWHKVPLGSTPHAARQGSEGGCCCEKVCQTPRMAISSA